MKSLFKPRTLLHSAAGYGGGDEQNSVSLEGFICLLQREEKRNLTDVEQQKIGEGVRESQFKDLTLAEYVIAIETYCHLCHQDCRRDCNKMITAAKIVLTEKHVALPSIWMRAFPNIKYDCEKAQRRLLQMPVASLSFAEGCFIVERREYGLYDDTKREIFTRIKHSEELSDKAEKLRSSLKEFSGLLRAKPNGGERERMKHLRASSHNLSSRQASKLGIWNLRKELREDGSSRARN